MKGNLYKNGLKRILVIKDYSFSHVTCKEWFYGKKTTTVRSKKELKNFDLICTL